MIIIPKLNDLYTSIVGDLEANYTSTIPVFGKVFLRALAGVQAAKIKLFYLAIASVQKNIFVDTADPESKGGTLERFGRVKLNRDPLPATSGQYDVTVTGTIGATIPANTTFKSDDDSVNPGKLFVLDTAFTLVSNPDSITIRALESGLISKLSVTDTLTATAPIASVDSSVEVSAESVEPLSAEDIELYRSLAIEAYRLEPQGGSPGDYKIWASDVQGVKTVYPYATSGASGEIDIYIEATEADSTDGKGTPSSAMINDVSDVIEYDPDTTKPTNERGRRPLGVFDTHLYAVSVKEIDVNITGFVGVTAELQTKIFNALELQLKNVRPFISGADVLSERNDLLNINKIINTIFTAATNSVFDEVGFDVDSVGFTSYVFENGNIPHLNSVNYI